MTRVVFIDEKLVILLDSELPGPALVETIANGSWILPAALAAVLGQPTPRLRAVRQGRLVIVSPAEPHEPSEILESLPRIELSPRQREVLQGLADGQTNKAIAAKLKLHPRTVELHVAAIKRRFGTTSRMQSVLRGVALGLCKLKPSEARFRVYLALGRGPTRPDPPGRRMKNGRYQILLTNDDGIQSPGLWAAAKALSKIGFVTVAAPRDQASSTGRSLPITSDGRITATQLKIGDEEWLAYAVGGTPAQTVLHGVLEIIGEKPDLVVAGINYGENLAEGITISGTVGAAMEGASLGIPSMAVSLQLLDEDFYSYSETVDFSTAAYFTEYFAKRMIARRNARRRAPDQGGCAGSRHAADPLAHHQPVAQALLSAAGHPHRRAGRARPHGITSCR